MLEGSTSTHHHITAMPNKPVGSGGGGDGGGRGRRTDSVASRKREVSDMAIERKCQGSLPRKKKIPAIA